jgi:hypothetical protein
MGFAAGRNRRGVTRVETIGRKPLSANNETWGHPLIGISASVEHRQGHPTRRDFLKRARTSAA